jgi:2-polyprenyl-6-hydroxyphenyl methylase/3-demethylubiquinone-9 3-methyltransferase
VVGIDAAKSNVLVATEHAKRDPSLGNRLTYKHSTVEQLLKEQQGQQFDVVTSLEVVEHVAEVEGFVRDLCGLVRPGGGLVVSTLNKTLKSYLLAVLAAENLLRWVPQGTHDWDKFLSPQLLVDYILLNNNDNNNNNGSNDNINASRKQKKEWRVGEVMGVVFNPITRNWELSSTDTSVNYFVFATALYPSSLHKES